MSRCICVLVAAAAVAALLGACALFIGPTVAGYEKMLNTWIGVAEIDLVRSWGAPQSVYEAGGRRFLGYAAQHKVFHGGTPATITTVIDKEGRESTSTTSGTPDRTEIQSCQTTFELVGTQVVAWSHRGEHCVAME